MLGSDKYRRRGCISNGEDVHSEEKRGNNSRVIRKGEIINSSINGNL